jgi:hypothetical protein
MRILNALIGSYLADGTVTTLLVGVGELAGCARALHDLTFHSGDELRGKYYGKCVNVVDPSSSQVGWGAGDDMSGVSAKVVSER